MNERSSGPPILVNAEIDSMGGVLDAGAGTDSKASPRRAAIEKAHSELRQEFDVLDAGAGTDSKASPRRAAIEKAHSELRQEFDVRDERRRELEFLEKGGNPLDFKLRQAASVSVQSTSHTDQHPEQIVSSVGKGNIPSTASPLGDSIESSERPANVSEPTSADNLLLFELEDELVVKGKNSAHNCKRNNISSFEKSSQRDGIQKAKESEDSGNFRPYARRYRSKLNRDGARSNSTESIPPRAGLLSSLPARHNFKDTKGLRSEINSQTDQSKSSHANPKYASTNGDLGEVGVRSDNRMDSELNGLRESSADMTNICLSEGVLDVAKDVKKNEQKEQLNVHAPESTLDRDTFIQPDTVFKNERFVSVSVECSTPHVTSSNDNENCSGELKKIRSPHSDRENLHDKVQTSDGALTTKNKDLESSGLSLARNNESDLCNNSGNVDKFAKDMDNTLVLEETENLMGGRMVKENTGTDRADGGLITNDDYDSSHQNHRGHKSIVEKEMHTVEPGLQNAVDFSSKIDEMETNDPAVPDNNTEPHREISPTVRHQDTFGSSVCELTNFSSSGLDPVDSRDIQTIDSHSKLLDRAHEDSILEEARSIEAKRKRITKLCVHTSLLEKSQKSHWDFVLEEMAWLANDVAQERLWKMAAASNISSQVALTSRSRLAEHKLFRNQKKVANTLAKAVMQFWHSLQELVNSDDPSVSMKERTSNLEVSKEKELQQGENSVPVKGYGVRFLKYTRTNVPCTRAEAPLTPDSTSGLGIQESLDEHEFIEESLVYLVSFGAMETYRKSIESCLIQIKKTGSSATEEEVDTSMYDAAEDLFQGDTYDEEEGETSMYYNPGSIEESKPSKFSLKKQKNLKRAYDARSYEPEGDFSNEQCPIGSSQPILIRKQPATNNVGCIPTKRVRTAARQRFQIPFSTEATGSLQTPNKTDGSSGDTNSFQDDQSTFHSGPQIHKSMEVESAAAHFEKTLPCDEDIFVMSKKKKKAKHLNSSYDQRWQPESVNHNEQRVNIKKRLEQHLLDSNGSGLTAKKPKMMKHALDNTFDNSSPRTGSIPSPVASQMSNMSNTQKFMKLIGGRGRKSKRMKISPGQTGPGNPWSLFEDQALVVFVHDMGPNWELVSDAINSTLQFKCIFRKAIECKERHKNLMDRTAGDGADSAEDSGSSQPYPSTLPGIPKGSARQLFQRLQGPMEEDTLKSHFEKIILIGQMQHYQRSQRDNQEMKQIAPVHNSHAMALSQVFPNNPNGGFLTPLDLCDVSGASPDAIPHGYQGSQSSGLSITNQGFVSPFLASGANLSLPGSSSMSSPSSAANASIRDGKYAVSRTSLPIDEQQRAQQYNPTGRNIQQPSFPVSGALPGTGRGARILPGGSGMGMLGGKNRTMPPARPGFQGIAPPSMLNNGSMLSSSMVGVPSPGTMHHGASSLSRPREALHPMRPSQTQEHQRKMMLPQHHLQVSQGNNQGVNGLNTSFSNQTASSVPTYRSSQQHQVSAPQAHVLQNSPHPHLQGSNPGTGTRHPAYTQLKEGQLHQQRLMQQRHQQYNFNAANVLTHAQPHMQPPVSSSTSQQASHPSSTPSSPQTSMSSQHQQKQNPPPQGFGRNPQTSAIELNNQMLKQRQRRAQQQQFQQTSRQHPQHWQQMQSQQQAKLLKGMGRGNMSLNQNLPIDPFQSNGTCMTPSSQVGGKGEQVVHSMQCQGLNSGSIQSSVQPPRSEMPLQPSNQTQLQQKLSSVSSPSLSTQFNQMPSHSDNNGSQGHAQSVSSESPGHDSHQAALPSVSNSNHHHRQIHLQQPKKLINQAQPGGQRLLHQNREGSSELTSDSLANQPHVDQHLVNNTSDIDTTASMPQFTMEHSSVTPAIYSSRASSWKAREAVYDASMQSPVSPFDSVAGSRPSSNSTQPINLIQRQFSGGPVSQHQLEKSEKSQDELPEYQAPPEQHMQHLESG